MAAKRDPLLDWFNISAPAEKKDTSTPETAREVDGRGRVAASFGSSSSSGYSRLIQLGDRLEQMEAESRSSAEQYYDSEQEWVSYFDQEEDQFITGRPVRVDARPGDDDYAPVLSSDVFDKYYQAPHTYNPSYPITACWRKITDTIESNPVTIIEGATGSGKTTQVPQYILDRCASGRKHCNILCTQPRRIAATSIANFVCKERRWQLGTLVGYQIGLSRSLSEDTRLTFVTTGVLLQKLIGMKNLNQYTHIILDEVHERDQDTDFCLLIVRKLLRTNSPNVKIVLMSASIDTHIFRNYFTVRVNGYPVPSPVVSIPGRTYTVQLYYLDDLQKLGRLPSPDMEDPRVTADSMELCARLIRDFDRLEREAENKLRGPRSGTSLGIRGTVLVFLPGLPEIKEMDACLTRLLYDAHLTVLPLHSSVTLEEQQRAFRAPERGWRKVILATNIAESSITVPDIRYVIDFCLCKELASDAGTNYQCLQLTWASKASLKQRQGRAGRVAAGTCYRLITREAYHRDLLDYTTPEMQRCPLESTVLRAKLLEMGEPRRILASALQPPNLSNIEKTILNLKEVGALSVYRGDTISPYDGDLTFVGRVLAALPVDVKVGKMILLGHVFGCLSEMLTIGAALSLKSFFTQPYHLPLEAFRAKVSWAHSSNSDCIAMLNAYQEWLRRKTTGQFRDRRMEVEWGGRNFIQIKAINEVADLVKDLENRLEKFNIKPSRSLARIDSEEYSANELLVLKIIICGGFYPNFFLWSTIDNEEAPREICGLSPLSTVMLSGMPAYPLQYRAALCQMFDQCGRGKMMHFEGNKVYLEFERPAPSRHQSDQIQSHKALPAVYLALKLRHLQQTHLELYTTEKGDELEKERLMYTGDGHIAGRSSHHLAASSSTNTAGIAPLDLPQLGYIQIIISEVVDPAHFWAQRVDTASTMQLQSMMDAVNAASDRLVPLLSSPEDLVGQVCVAPYSENGQYYRAKVQSIVPSNGLVMVHFVDFGNNDFVAASTLRELPLECLQLPPQAFECFLIGVRPSLHKSPDGQWTKEAVARFTELSFGKVLVADIFSQVQGTLRVALYDTSGVEDVMINNLLRMEGYAEPKVVEEPYQSKVARKQAQVEAELAASSSSSSSMLSEAGRRGSARTKLSEVVHSAEWSTEDQPYTQAQKTGRYPPNMGRITRARLKGPFNPHEVSFQSLTSVGRTKSTRVAKDSVNSVTLNDEPQDTNDRMMVATHVSVNAAGSAILVRNTTLLPNIHGLPALTCLLFAPIVEMRTDSMFSHYIGALCGLGCDPATGESLYGLHDLEIAFDTAITQQDLDRVNHLRLAVNLALDSDDGATTWGPSAVEKIQKRARMDLLELLHIPRESIPVDTFKKQYQWNQIPPQYLIHPEQRGIVGDASFLPLHPGVALTGVHSPCSLPPAAHKMAEHIAELHRLANESSDATSVSCQLCHVKCGTAQALLRHIQSKAHKYEEKLALQGTPTLQ